MPREPNTGTAKIWLPATVPFGTLPESVVSDLVIEGLQPLADVLEKHANELGYIVIQRVLDRHHGLPLARKNVDPRDLAEFLPPHNGSDFPAPPTARVLGQAAVAWLRGALAEALGDGQESTFKVILWQPKGSGTQKSGRVTVSRLAANEPTVVPAPASESPWNSPDNVHTAVQLLSLFVRIQEANEAGKARERAAVRKVLNSPATSELAGTALLGALKFFTR